MGEALEPLSLHTPRHRRIATEGALLGVLAERGLSERLAIISDDAGQFKVLRHGLCWIHYLYRIFIYTVASQSRKTHACQMFGRRDKKATKFIETPGTLV